MRRLRLLGQNERLLREAVRDILQEVSPETERLADLTGVPKQGTTAKWATGIGTVSDAIGAVLNFVPSTHKAVTYGNVGADIVSVIASGYLLYDEIERHNLAMEAVEMLRAENEFYHDATGSYGHDVDDIDKFELYYDARAFCSAIQFLLGLAAAVPSVIQAISGSSPISLSSRVEITLKIAKASIAALNSADATGRLDLAQGVSNVTSAIGDLWDKVSKTSEYAALINKHGPEVLAMFRDPRVKAAVAAGAMSGNSTLALSKTSMDAIAIIEETLPKLKAA